ncbi:MAG: hypothetical protein Q7V62_05370, partial [Actinomycetota bacterium]|nr:hypothetical protein [Actinomycetota bacterium]
QCQLDQVTKNDMVCACTGGYNETNCANPILRDRTGALCGGADHGTLRVDASQVPTIQRCECLAGYRLHPVTGLCYVPPEVGCPVSLRNGLPCGGDTQGACDVDPVNGNDYRCRCRVDTDGTPAFVGPSCSEAQVAVYLAGSGALVVCTGHGIPDPLGTGFCLCNVGWIGLACEIYAVNRPCGSGQSFLDTEAAGIQIYQSGGALTDAQFDVASTTHGPFDGERYLVANPDVRTGWSGPPVQHWALYGSGSEGREAWLADGSHGTFDKVAYAAAYAAYGVTEANALVDYAANYVARDVYIIRGAPLTHGLFDGARYLTANPDVRTGWSGSPVEHWALYGSGSEGRDAWLADGSHGPFDAAAYAAAYGVTEAGALIDYRANYGTRDVYIVPR